jgi:thiosulfate/3-mercaptopyruvate sulfurtransferase
VQTLITAPELATRLAGRSDVKLVDVRWQLGGPPGRDAYLAGHIPGAAYADLDTELAGHAEPAEGRHPLPPIEGLQDAARRWGIDDGDSVVVYDDLGNQSAARAWWLLRHAGVHEVLLLDGGLNAWAAAGLPVETGTARVVLGRVSLHYGHLVTVDADAAGALPARGVLLDARAGARYRGEVEPVDPQAGHIPGAVSAPSAENLTADGRFLPAAELRTRFEALGVTDAAPVGVYCGSGVTAAHEIAALSIAGFEAALYPGSWSQWSNLPGRPVETGAGPSCSTSSTCSTGT